MQGLPLHREVRMSRAIERLAVVLVVSFYLTILIIWLLWEEYHGKREEEACEG